MNRRAALKAMLAATGLTTLATRPQPRPMQYRFTIDPNPVVMMNPRVFVEFMNEPWNRGGHERRLVV